METLYRCDLMMSGIRCPATTVTALVTFSHDLYPTEQVHKIGRGAVFRDLV